MSKPSEDEHPGPKHTHEATRRSEQIQAMRHTSVGPENHVILVGFISTLEKVEEDVPCFYVYISCIRPLLTFVLKSPLL